MGVTAADYDGDGDPDLYLTAWGPDQFYRREEDGYVDATDEVGLGHAGWTTSAVAFDYDLDGDFDLFAAQYVRFVLGEQPWCGREDMGLRFYCDPRGSLSPLWIFSTAMRATASFPRSAAKRVSRARAMGWAWWLATTMGTATPTCTWPTI